MTGTKHLSNEDVSALMDGAMTGIDASELLAAVVRSDEALANWHHYHLIGDIIRSEDLAPSASELNFADRVMDAISVQSADLQPLGVGAVASAGHPSANTGRWRVALAGTVGIGVLALLLAEPLGPRFFGNTVQPVTAHARPDVVAPAVSLALEEERPVMARDPELDALLSAHQQMGGHSALQTPLGFLRNATFDRSRP